MKSSTLLEHLMNDDDTNSRVDDSGLCLIPALNTASKTRDQQTAWLPDLLMGIPLAFNNQPIQYVHLFFVYLFSSHL